jgi:anti-sigma regulatory factor (Ser/Thr protein kinase)
MLARQKSTFRLGEVQGMLGEKVSRQYVHPILKDLVARGELVAGGRGRAAVYASPFNSDLVVQSFDRTFVNDGLEEHILFDYIKRHAGFLKKLRENIFSIYDYAMQEMLNNAIEHSRSKTVNVQTSQDEENVYFTIRDEGIGVFANIMKKCGLDSELDAVNELLKGKTTTDPEGHTGEGIFFTSKIADVYILESHGLRLRVDNTLPDIFIEELDKRMTGTTVRFSIAKKSARHLRDIFKEFESDDEENAFDRTQIHVRLYARGTVYISRSQARRIMSGLEKKFQTIVLDFDRVQTIGQAFADEIFRVFSNKYPRITLLPINTNKAVAFMIRRALATAAMQEKR